MTSNRPNDYNTAYAAFSKAPTHPDRRDPALRMMRAAGDQPDVVELPAVGS